MFHRYGHSKVKNIICSTIFKQINKKKTLKDNINYLNQKNIYSELARKNYMNYYDTVEFRNYLPNLRN